MPAADGQWRSHGQTAGNPQTGRADSLACRRVADRRNLRHEWPGGGAGGWAQPTPQLRGRRGHLGPHHRQANAPCSRQVKLLIDSRAYLIEHAPGTPTSDAVYDRRPPVAHAVARAPTPRHTLVSGYGVAFRHCDRAPRRPVHLARGPWAWAGGYRARLTSERRSVSRPGIDGAAETGAVQSLPWPSAVPVARNAEQPNHDWPMVAACSS
jgi:hypothetical protein